MVLVNFDRNLCMVKPTKGKGYVYVISVTNFIFILVLVLVLVSLHVDVKGGIIYYLTFVVLVNFNRNLCIIKYE